MLCTCSCAFDETPSTTKIVEIGGCKRDDNRAAPTSYSWYFSRFDYNDQIASVKAGITDRCKRGVNACLHDNPPLRGTWKSLQGQKLNELSLQMVRTALHFLNVTSQTSSVNTAMYR